MSVLIKFKRVHFKNFIYLESFHKYIYELICANLAVLKQENSIGSFLYLDNNHYYIFCLLIRIKNLRLIWFSHVLNKGEAIVVKSEIMDYWG